MNHLKVLEQSRPVQARAGKIVYQIHTQGGESRDWGKKECFHCHTQEA